MDYESDKYVDWFEIDEGYYPEINESSIKDPKNKWQQTFPHGDIVSLLKTLERALSRSDKKSLWIAGAYGTGKSRIIWMMQNLLSCSADEFEAYFDEYENLRREIDLRGRLRAVRGGKVVTAYRYATGDITSTQKLIFAVFESLTSALRKGGYKFDGAKTLRGGIVKWLESDPANLEMFRAKIRKPEYRMSRSLAGRSAEEIVERLKNPNAEVSQLVEDILKLGEKEGIRAFNIDMTGLKDWITEVIAVNNLKALVLLWDEFSKFFGNNRNNLDEFQNLAELSNIVPFYLVIATHEIESLASGDDQAFRIVRDRFITKNVTMPDNIAFELIGHALNVKESAREEWRYISAALVERTAASRRAIMKFAKISDESLLTGILPIHPMAAILLKNISTYFASNQRSMFNFIKNSDPSIKAFQEFIATRSPAEGDLLTIDYLWSFFYESGTDERGGSVGRMNLDVTVRAILDTHTFRKGELNPDEEAVLKTILLLQATSYKGRDDVEIFLPSERNLELAFDGANNFESGRAVNIANDLVRRGILFKRPGKIPLFAAMSMAGDQAAIEHLKKQIADEANTAALVEEANLLDDMKDSLKPSQKQRYDLRAAVADNFTATINRITNERQDYHIKAVVCFARNENEHNKLHNLLAKAITEPRYRVLAFIDASANLINVEVFERWVENSANEQYWRGKDNALAEKMKTNAESCLKEWRESFGQGSFVYYPAGDNEKRRGFSCQNINGVVDEMTDNVRRIYRYSFDDAAITDTLFQGTQLQRLAEAGITQEKFSMLSDQQARRIFGDLWQLSGEYWKDFPSNMISRLKVEVDRLIEDELKRNTRISFEDIVEYLLERGFMPLNIYAAMLGFILKEYARDPYRYSAGAEGNIGGAMTPKKLAEYIGESLKNVVTPVRNYRPKYIEIMSKNQRRFMDFAEMIFNVSEDVSVEQSAQKLRNNIMNLGYPLWCYVDSAADKYKDFLKLLAEITNSKEAVGVSALAERAGQILINNPQTFDDMRHFLTSTNGREFFTDFLRDFEGGIIFELAKKIGVEDAVTECQRRVTSGDGIWLHDKETAEGDLRKLIVDYKIVVESQKFGIGGNSFKSCIAKWAEHCQFNVKIPADTIESYYPTARDFFIELKGMVRSGDIPQSRRDFFLSQLVDNAETINAAISNPIKILREKYSYQLNGLDDAAIKDIHAQLSHNSFTDSHGNFVKQLNDLVDKLKQDHRKYQLLSLWNKVAKVNLPREWSKEHRTPLLAMVPENEQSNAQRVFNAVMSDAPDEREMQFAIEYLENPPAYFKSLNDSKKIEAAFRNKIINGCGILLDNNDEIRQELETKISADAYSWYPNNDSVKKLVNKCAENKYYIGGVYEKLTARVMQMSDSEAKHLLIELLNKNYEVGLKVLSEK